ncbi:pitrilysin family protein [Terriglobus sp. TAA 43]|uniref:M16 family metallopeptidase n=1 Tax=Terriglobus sp. TAA 43 TaxID=278961 RepID=UPI000649144D|nr:pitrilysin family protein [Terriglobus sp. TAA 43]
MFVLKARTPLVLAAVLSVAVSSPLFTIAQKKPAVAKRASTKTLADGPNVTRETLPNGLRVVIVRNRLAPVATVELNILAGGNQTPVGFPGTAHALEHMAFRGCTGMTADQTAAIYARLGGDNNADTQGNVTQFYATVPSTDVEVALRAEAACMVGIDNADHEWEQERGAITQEVQRDLSSPTYKLISRLNEGMFAGTPYAHDALGTKESFEKTTGADLRAFYDKWYAPSNAVLVIVGDVDPAQTMTQVREFFGPVKRREVPKEAAFTLSPVKTETFTLDSNLPYTLAVIGYRLPGTESKDYAAAQVLADVLSSQRGDLYAMVPAGKALGTQFGMAGSYPKASLGFGMVAVASEADAKPALDEMRTILNRYAQDGVPADLVDAAKRSEITEDAFGANSIPGLAQQWSQALGADRKNSPAEATEAIKRVTVADVNRVAKQYLLHVNTMTATLKPVASGAPTEGKGFGGGEKLTSTPTKEVALPEWAAKPLAELRLPHPMTLPSDEKLPNGVRLIVRTDHTSPTVTLTGSVQHNEDLDTPKGKEGVADVLEELYGYGTTSLDRIAFQKELDDIGATEDAGFSFGLKVLKENFARGVELLADNQLHPALPAEAFPVVQKQTAELTAGNLTSPGYRTRRALSEALLPKNDPSLRQQTPQTITALKLDDVKSYMKSTMRPDLTTIVVVGDITPAEARAQVEKAFGAWTATGPKPQVDLPPVPPNKPTAAIVGDPEAVQDSVTLSHTLQMNRFSPDYYPMQLGTYVLGGGFYASRLYHDLRQVAGYVYTVDVNLRATRTRATYTVDYGSEPVNVSKARALVERDLQSMKTTPVTPGELTLAKSLILRQLQLSESSQAAVAGALLARAQMGLPLNESDNAAKTYLGLSAEEVQASFARNLRVEDLVQVVRGPAPQ